MQQLVVAIVLTVVLVAFSVANSHHVALSYVFGEPTRVRLIFLLWIAYGAGLLASILYLLSVRAARRARARREGPDAEIVPEVEEA